jgi:hypothetical protein
VTVNHFPSDQWSPSAVEPVPVHPIRAASAMSA